MTAKTKKLKFNNNSITFLLINGMWLIPAKIIGLALGYAKDGQKLGDHLSSWSKKWGPEDFKTFTGSELKKLREANPEIGVPSSTSQLVMLSPSGVTKVLQRSRAGLALEFRNFLAKEATFLFKDHLGSLEAPAKQLALELPEKAQDGVNHLSEVLQILEVGSKKGLMTKKEQKLALNAVLNIKMQAFTKDNKVTHFFDPDGTVDPTKLPALSQHAMAIPEGSVNLIERGQRHPDFLDWESATDIGNRYGLKHELVKKYIKAYANNLGSDLPNNIAQKYIEGRGGKFNRPDKHGFLVDHFVSARIGGIAIYSKIDGNKLVWRNYWSPNAVKEICKLIENGRGIEPLAPTQQPATEKVVDVEATTLPPELEKIEKMHTEEVPGQSGV